jgi:alpha-tubulin suppressor-like RCC1 family protein
LLDSTKARTSRLLGTALAVVVATTLYLLPSNGIVAASQTGLTGVLSVVNAIGDTACAVLTSGGVDCWGDNSYGQLGNDSASSSATPVQVVGVGGVGTLFGVASLASDGQGFCALLLSGGVDCWGRNDQGQAGNGGFGNRTTPVQVIGVGGVGTLSGVAAVTNDGESFCAVLNSGDVDCWGDGYFGNLGDGNFYTTGNFGSATPVQVVGVGRVGTLSGVTSLTAGVGYGICALLSSGGVDCWGDGSSGQLGNGLAFNDNTESATPVQVVGVGGVSLLSGVASISTDLQGGFCALLESGGVDCWGEGDNGELGNGGFASSATPTQVVAVGGVGALSGVASLSGDSEGYCALLTSGGVDCWGTGSNGNLGNGAVSNRDAPVQVEGVGGVGALSAVVALTDEAEGFCALLTSGGVDCWGFGNFGNLGDGNFYTTGNLGSPTPVQVVGVGGVGTLSGVTSLSFSADGESSCAILNSSGLDCWGYGADGELGNGLVNNSAIPVQVLGIPQAPSTEVIIPFNGAALRGTHAVLDALASAGFGVKITTVQFVLTGGSYNKSVIGAATPTLYGYVYSWNTTSVPGGTYTLQSLATDNDGNAAYSTGTTITVDNVPPTTAVLIPSNGAHLRGTVALDASASASFGVQITKVQFVLTGRSFNKTVIGTATATIFGWVFVTNTTLVHNGTYTLQSLATDAAGNIAYSQGITIKVVN